MFHYYSNRSIINNEYDIPNINRVDLYGQPLKLETEVENAFPGLHFLLFMDDTQIKFSFDTELTVEQQAILELTVEDHRNGE